HLPRRGGTAFENSANQGRERRGDFRKRPAGVLLRRNTAEGGKGRIGANVSARRVDHSDSHELRSEQRPVELAQRRHAVSFALEYPLRREDMAGTVLLLEDDADQLEMLSMALSLVCGCDSVRARSYDELTKIEGAALGSAVALLDVNLGPRQPS